jgi:hypothetical protein
VCNYVVGDGVGASEISLGSFGSELNCAVAVRNLYPLANGATYGAWGACYAEFGMQGINPDTEWRTCLFGG